MSEYEGLIAEIVEPATGPDPTPIARTITWRGEAATEDAARIAAWSHWDDVYGDGNRPPAIVKVTSVIG